MENSLDSRRGEREINSGASNVLLLATTATLDRSELDACLAAGMDACLTKPFGLSDLNRTLGSLVRDHERNRAGAQ